MAETTWDQFDMENKITAILSDASKGVPEHYGKPYLTAYQLAIEFERAYSLDAGAIGKPIGGAGIGQPNSLAEYIAGQLTQRVISGNIQHIEIGFMSSKHVQDLTFNHRGKPIRWSGYISLFRLKS